MIGIANPWGALALAAVGILVALHLHDRRRRMIPVATLFLWRQLPPSPLERRRFRPELLFLVRLGLLLALIGGLLRPYVERALGVAWAPRQVIVLDVSASMAAREADGTRFEIARRRARALARAGETMIVAAAERPHVALGWTADRARVEERLEALEPLDVPGRIAPALELALGEVRARPGTRAAVLTDLPREQAGLGADALASLDWIQVGATDDNLAVAGFAVEQAPFAGPRGATAAALVRSYASRPRRVVVETTVDGVRWARREIALAARGSAHVLFTDPPAAGVVTVTLAGGDALAADDRALGWIAPADTLDLLLVSDSTTTSAAARALAASAHARLEVVNRARFAAAPATARRVVLLDGFVPEEAAAAAAALLIAPPPGNPLCPGSGTVDAAAVVDWEPEHAVTAGLTGLGALEVGAATELVRPDWGEAIVLAASERQAFPLLVIGERDGRRLACLAAALPDPLITSDRLPLLILLLGTLDWLAEPFGPTAVAMPTGVPVLAGGGPQAPIAGPAGGLRVEGDPAVLVAERAGLYRVGPAGERIVLANLRDDRESDIGRDGGGEWRAVAAAAAPAPSARQEIGWWLYAAGALLLVLEWLIWWRRVRP